MELIVIDYFLGSNNLSDELRLHFFLCQWSLSGLL